MTTFNSADHPRNHPTGKSRFSDKANSEPESTLVDPAVAAATLSTSALVEAADEAQALNKDTRDWGSTGIDVGSRSPWGEVDYAIQVAPGITSASTPGHGGVKLSPERNRAVHPALRVKGGWYEEDCDEAIVSFTFPEETRIRKAIGYTVDKELDEHIAHNDERVCNWFPDGWEKATGKTLRPGDSHTRDGQNWLAAHANDFVVTSALTDPDDPNWVNVTARRGEEEGRFRISEGEYRPHGQDAKEIGQGSRVVIDLDRHEKLAPIVKPAPVPAQRYHTVAADGLTPAASAKVGNDLNKRWRLADGSVRHMSDIIQDGITGKSVSINNGKREYYLQQMANVGDSNIPIFPVTKATWDAVNAPDDRSTSRKLQQELLITSHAYETTLRGRRSQGFNVASDVRAAGLKVEAATAAYEAALHDEAAQ